MKLEKTIRISLDTFSVSREGIFLCETILPLQRNAINNYSEGPRWALSDWVPAHKNFQHSPTLSFLWDRRWGPLALTLSGIRGSSRVPLASSAFLPRPRGFLACQVAGAQNNSLFSFSNVTCWCFELRYTTVPPGKARRRVKPKRTTQEAVKAKVSHNTSLQGTGDHWGLAAAAGAPSAPGAVRAQVFQEGFSVGLFCCEVPVGVLVLRAPGLGLYLAKQFNDLCPEEVLECTAACCGCCRRRRAGLQAAGSAVLSVLQSCLVPGIDVTAATTSKSLFVRDEVLPLSGILALVAGPAAVADLSCTFHRMGWSRPWTWRRFPSHCPLLLVSWWHAMPQVLHACAVRCRAWWPGPWAAWTLHEWQPHPSHWAPAPWPSARPAPPRKVWSKGHEHFHMGKRATSWLL